MWALAFLAALAAGATLLFQLWGEPFLRGVDAYYYAVQASSLLETGALRIPDSSPVHYLIAGLAGFGFAVEDAVRLWVALSLLLFCLAFYMVFLREKPRNSVFAALCLAWPLLSPSLLYCALEFPKNFSFMIVMNLWLLCLGPGTQRLRRWALLLLLMAAAIFLHKMALVYAVAVLAALGLAALSQKVGWGGLRPHLGRVAMVLTAFGMLLLVFFYLLPDFLHLQDIFRFSGSRLTPGVLALGLEPGLPLAVKVELGLALLALGMLLWQARGNTRLFLLMAAFALPAFIPAFGGEAFSLGERFGLLLPYGVALGAALQSVFLCPGGAYQRRPLFAFFLLAGLLAALAVGWQRLDYSHPAQANPPYAAYARISAKLEKLDIPMLIVHQGMHYYYKFRTGREAFSYEPEPHWPKERTWRLVYGPSPEELFSYMPKDCTWQSGQLRLFAGTPYSLVSENCYARFRASVDKAMNPKLHALLWNNAFNPARSRPAFLYKRHLDDEESEFSALPAQ